MSAVWAACGRIATTFGHAQDVPLSFGRCPQRVGSLLGTRRTCRYCFWDLPLLGETCRFWAVSAAWAVWELASLGRAYEQTVQHTAQRAILFGTCRFCFRVSGLCHTFGMCRFWAVSAAWAHFLVRAALAFWDVPLLGGVSGLGGVWAAWAPFWVCSALAFWDVPLLGGDAPHLPLLGLAFFIIIEHTQCKLPPIIWEHVGPGIAPHLPHLGLAFLGCAAFAFGF